MTDPWLIDWLVFVYLHEWRKVMGSMYILKNPDPSRSSRIDGLNPIPRIGL